MADFNEYKGVWVFCEQRQGALMSTDFELVSEARKLADELGCEVTGLLLGDNVEGIAKELGGYGADKVLVCDSPLLKDYTTDAYAKVVCDMVNEYKPEVLLMDEPCSAIDPTSVSKVEDLMAELAPEMTIIIVTHSMQQAARISDYTAFFLQEVAGEPATLIEYGQTDAIFTSPVDSRTEDYITGRFG